MTDLELIEAFLKSRGASLWGRSFDVVTGKSVRDAAEWFLGEIDALDKFIETYEP